MQSIMAFLAVIPRLIDLAIRLGEQIRESKFDAWLESLDESVRALEAAKSPEEKRNAAVAISRVIARR